MKITYRDKSYWVVWKHEQPIRERRKYYRAVGGQEIISKLIPGKPGKTTCYIYDDTKQGEPYLFAEASVGCHSKDNYNKEKGRQLSFTKTMEAADFTKPQRDQFWEQYNNSKPGGRW